MVITIESSSLVKPAAKPTPTVDPGISDCDQDKPITHAPTVYFYSPPVPIFSSPSPSEILKTSLSQVLVHFYPLAGRLHLIAGGRVRLECNSAGALFYEAKSDAKMEDFKDFAPTTDLGALIPSMDYTGNLHQIPLLLVQVTEFSCGGVSLGLGISSIMADGTSASHFVSEWARIARGEPLANPPFLDRSVLLASDSWPPSRKFEHDRFVPQPLLLGRSNDLEERSKETTVAMLHLSKTQVERLKEMANASRAHDASSRAYSRYEVVAGHMWRCACKARGHMPKQPTKLSIQVSFRRRMPLPKWYFGNAVLGTGASSHAGDLMTKALGYACSKIREATEMVTEEYVKSALDLVKRQPDLTHFRTFHAVGSTQGSFRGNPNMEITSWLGVPLQGTDFGWGKEIYMGPGSLNFDGKSFILPGSGEDGSVSIALRLQVSHMDDFIGLFYEDII